MINHVQARLDDEIAALTLVLSSLRTRRNSFSPISRLPPETLASIFIQCARSSDQPNRYSIQKRSVPDWVNVSHVCRRWRDVALNCSTLWSFLFVSSHRWTDELLARSKTAPLKVCIDSDFTRQSRELYLLRKVATQANRIQVFYLRLTQEEAERILSLFSSPAPLLQSLQISLKLPTIPVTGVLFEGNTPALRKLELTNYYAFPLASPILHGLTVLGLRDLHPSLQPTLAELRIALSHMQDLAQLHLESALPSARNGSTGQSFEVSEKISFPRLSRLSIVAPFSTVVLLLSCFGLPTRTEVRLRCCFEAETEDYTPIYPLLAGRFIAPSQEIAPIIHSSIIQTVLATVGFVFSTAARDTGRHECPASTTSYDLGRQWDWDCNIPLRVDVALRTSLSKDREDLIAGIYGSIPLTNLQCAYLSFDMGTTLSSAFWTMIFSHLQELRSLRLSEVGLRGLVQVLSVAPQHGPENNGGDPESGSSQVFAPALEELELCNVNFSKKCSGRSRGDPKECSCSAPCLGDALSRRQAEGHGLRRLAFKKCMHVRECDVGGLRESVIDVVWDGLTRTHLGSESEDEAGDEDDEGPHARRGRARILALHHGRW